MKHEQQLVPLNKKAHMNLNLGKSWADKRNICAKSDQKNKNKISPEDSMVCRPSEVPENLFSFHAKRKALPSLGLLG